MRKLYVEEPHRIAAENEVKVILTQIQLVGHLIHLPKTPSIDVRLMSGGSPWFDLVGITGRIPSWLAIHHDGCPPVRSPEKLSGPNIGVGKGFFVKLSPI